MGFFGCIVGKLKAIFDPKPFRGLSKQQEYVTEKDG